MCPDAQPCPQDRKGCQQQVRPQRLPCEHAQISVGYKFRDIDHPENQYRAGLKLSFGQPLRQKIDSRRGAAGVG